MLAGAALAVVGGAVALAVAVAAACASWTPNIVRERNPRKASVVKEGQSSRQGRQGQGQQRGSQREPKRDVL